MTLNFAVIEAPSPLGLFPKGVQEAPAALLAAGLADGLNARHAGRIDPPPYTPDQDAGTGVSNAAGIARYSASLADRIGSVLDAGEVPVVLGGDCSILVGCALAMRRRGRAGLMFVDGHADFFQPDAEPNGEAASMDLALVTGRGPAIVADLENLCPLIRDQDVALVGRRDGKDAKEAGSQRVEDVPIEMIDLKRFRQLGAENSVKLALDTVFRPDLDGFWLHLDADVLNDAIMPAVDYRQPNGLKWDELEFILSSAVASGGLRGIDLTIYNPRLDPKGDIGIRYVQSLISGLIANNADAVRMKLFESKLMN